LPQKAPSYFPRKFTKHGLTNQSFPIDARLIYQILTDRRRMRLRVAEISMASSPAAFGGFQPGVCILTLPPSDDRQVLARRVKQESRVYFFQKISAKSLQ
jgi:hypothetical protein